MKRASWGWLLPVVALLTLAGVARGASDEDRIKKLEDMVRSQAAKIEQLEKKVAATSPIAGVDKAIGRTAPVGVLSPDQPDVDGTGLFAFGELLYWTAQQDGVVYASTRRDYFPGQPASPYGTGTRDHVVEAGWAAGFRAGLGYRLPYNGWDLKAAYSRIEWTDGDSLFDPDPADATYQIWSNINSVNSSEIAVERAKGRLDVEYSNLDLELGARFKVTDTISLRAFGGPRLMWLDQDLRVQYTGGGLGSSRLGETITSDNDVFAYGLRLGAEADWNLKHGFGFYTLAAGSLLTGELESRRKDTRDLNSDNVISGNETYDNNARNSWRVIPAIQLGMGINWQRKLLEKLNLKLSLGYEFNQIFNVVDRMVPMDDIHDTLSTQCSGDQAFHGLTFRLRLDF